MVGKEDIIKLVIKGGKSHILERAFKKNKLSMDSGQNVVLEILDLKIKKLKNETHPISSNKVS